MLDAVLTLFSVAIALYAGWRMLGRAFHAAWAAFQPVSTFPEAPAVVMSRLDASDRSLEPSVLRTDGGRTADGQPKRDI